MRIILLLIFICSAGLGLKAQPNLDSLWAIWQDEAEPDSIRLKAIHKLAWEGYLFSQPDSAFYFTQLYYDFAKRKGLKRQMANGLNTQGISYALRSNYIRALEYYRKGLSIQTEIGNKKGIASISNNIGLIFYYQGNYARALEYYRESLTIKEKISDKRDIANTMLNIGNIYGDQGEFDRALDYYQRSLAIYEGIGDKDGMANSLVNIGTIYTDQRDWPRALEFCQKGLKIHEEINYKQGMSNALYSIGIIYSEQGDLSQALEFQQRGLEICKEVGDKDGMAGSLIIIGELYSDQGNYLKALDYCQQGLKLAEEIEVLGPQKQACDCLYGTYKSMGKGNQALEYLEKSQVVDDSLNAEETARKLEQLEFEKVMLQDSIEKAEEARLVQETHEAEMREEEQTRNWSIAGGVLALLLAGGFYSRWRYVQRSKVIIEKEKDRSENLLLNILPAEIAQELKEKGRADARDFEIVSILFTDFKGFTEQSAKLNAADLVNEINHCFEAFDGIMDKYGIEKIKTIGDAYMAAGGLPVPTDDSVKNTVLAAMEMQEFISKRKAENDAKGEPAFEMRVGINTGPVVAGIVGVKKFQYDIWGDTVNTASRMESAGEVGKVNISQATYELLKDDPDFAFESRGKVEAKGKGEVEMYFVRERE